jgi:hypothetical protein
MIIAQNVMITVISDTTAVKLTDIVLLDIVYNAASIN